MDKLQYRGCHLDSHVYLLLVPSKVIMAHIFYVQKSRNGQTKMEFNGYSTPHITLNQLE